VPSHDRGLLARLDALVYLVADRPGLALLPDGRLAAAEERAAAHAAGLQPSADDDLGALGLLRARAGRLEASQAPSVTLTLLDQARHNSWSWGWARGWAVTRSSLFGRSDEAGPVSCRDRHGPL
jgi:hypothetical protein